MQRKSLEMFACLECDGALQLGSVTSEVARTGEIDEGQLECEVCHLAIPIVRSLPRLVASESYALSFGFQWNRFDRLQLDRHMKNDLRPGGEIVIDVYEKQGGFPPLKYLVRPFVKPLGTKGIYRLLSWTIPPAFDLKKVLYRIPVFGPRVGSLIPIGPLSHAPRLSYTDKELKQVKILSALDMLSPAYDQPQRIEDVRRWFEQAGFRDFELRRGYNGINAKGRRPI